MAQNQSRRVLLWLLLLLCIPVESFGETICGQDKAGMAEIIRDGTPVGLFSVALASTPQDRRRGLMHCPALAPGDGMLFFYPQAGERVFWMKNTVIDLAIIFITADGKIGAIAHGEPQRLKRLRSPDNTRHVLEINYAESRPLAVGDQVRLRFDKAPRE